MKKYFFLIVIIFLSAYQSEAMETLTPSPTASATPLPNATPIPIFTPINPPLPTSTISPLSAKQPSGEIIALLDNYFEARYKSFQHLALEDFSPLIVETDKGKSFWGTEEKKLALEIEHARIYNLAYMQYEFFLEYEDILIDYSSKSAKVTLLEGHNVIFKVSSPLLSSQRNITHEIELRQIDGLWKIESDLYEDYLWRWLNTRGMSANKLREELNALQEKPAKSIVSLNSPFEKIAYNRQGMIDYAHQWSISPRPYNPNYYDFTEIGGDCTNFVSQAIFEGGKIEMVFGGNHDIGTSGWYYYDINDRAIAWTWVDGLYNFIVNEQSIWGNKMVGYEVEAKNALAGDILQFNWGADTVWDHSVLVVSSESQDSDFPLLLIAGHSPDVDNYPHTTMLYSDDFRFIHISSFDN